MKYLNKIHTPLFLIVTLFISNVTISQAQQVTFRASAPAQVVEGQQFRLVYTLNREGRDIRLPNIDGFDVLFGPATSTSHSVSVINGQSTSNTSVTYTYTLMAKETGTFTIAPASINAGGSTYQSNSVSITVLPPDAQPQQGTASSGQQQTGTATPGTVSPNDAFIRAIVTKNNPFEQEGFTVTFRFYTTMNVSDIGRIEFPEFEGFMVEEIDLPRNVQLQMERYNDRNYFTADLRRVLLFPQRSGQMTIPTGSLDMTFSVPSGRRVSTFFGSQEVMADVRRTLTTNPITINVRPLPTPRPTNYSNAVGTFTFRPNISTTATTANEAMTIRLEISGTGNMKLIRTPEVQFPASFEVFDPAINQNFNVTTNGLTGTRTIEYMFIPRHEGEFTIPPIEFTYFDLNTNVYRTEHSPEYTLQIARDENRTVTGTFVNRQDVRVEQDIRFLKLGEPTFTSSSNFFVGSFKYRLWYIIPFVLLTTLYILNRKQIRENANVKLMRTKKANKVATKRLKAAEKYLKSHDKAKFYDEVLRALWGYFSDKLSIPVAQLSKNNIETELSKSGVSDTLTDQFIDILNTCEFARYAPAESDAAMDKLYNETVGAIGEMENKLNSAKARRHESVKAYIALIFAFACSFSAIAETTSVAEQAFRDGDFARSAELFEQIIAQGIAENKESAQLYYNLGNAYFRQNELGKAILNYERAFLLNPGDSDIRHNLRFARAHTTDRIEQSGNALVTNWVNSIRNLFSSNRWAAAGITFFLLFLGCIAVFMFVRLVWARKTAFYAGIVIFFLMIAANTFSFRQKNERINRDFAIVMLSGISIQASPDASSSELFRLHEGTKVRIRNSDGNWYEIEIDNGSVGWTLKQNVERI
jgi:tetratricopeptide (TPR) repeat protein